MKLNSKNMIVKAFELKTSEDVALFKKSSFDIGDILYKYEDTVLVFYVVDNFIYCFDESEPETDILKSSTNMGDILVSYGIELEYFKQDFGGKGLYLADFCINEDILVDLL
ncbi:hypothetical protein [Yersinia phage fHe-Yen9-03]|uniref:Uncharacterized protein n=1 Tax=Yersinia phage fHe-Yen9-03 TaxID=2052743 RepID=A0A2C9CXQ9_9CAUD|nr:hypothetical protein [Yersinia phage fHe-Yen9-03]